MYTIHQTPKTLPSSPDQFEVFAGASLLGTYDTFEHAYLRVVSHAGWLSGQTEPIAFSNAWTVTQAICGCGTAADDAFSDCDDLSDRTYHACSFDCQAEILAEADALAWSAE